MVRGSMGQDAPRPLLSAQTRAATTLARIVEAPAFPVIEADEGEKPTTLRARRAANVRWTREQPRNG